MANIKTYTVLLTMILFTAGEIYSGVNSCCFYSDVSVNTASLTEKKRNSSSLNFFRTIKNKRIHADSVIAEVNLMADSAVYYYSCDRYVNSDMCYMNIAHLWDEYLKYCKKKHIEPIMSRDTLECRISDCRLLQSLLPEISQIEKKVFTIPDNADDIVQEDRQKIFQVLKHAGSSIKDIEEQNRIKTNVVRHGFRRSLRQIDIIRKLIDEVYESERNNFLLKSKFYYNQAQKSNDTAVLRRFVDDCDYYKSDKEWCRKAKIELGLIDTSVESPVKKDISVSKTIIKPLKLSPSDSMHNEYKKAVETGDTSLLVKYVNKYSKRKIRKKESKSDSVNTILETIRKNAREREAYLNAHPLLNSENMGKIEIRFSGADDLQFQNICKKAVLRIVSDTINKTGMRFPVVLTIEKKENQIQFYLNGYVNTKDDILIEKKDSSIVYDFIGCRSGAQLLHKLKEQINQELNSISGYGELTMQMENINSAVYVIRVKKNESECVTMYAYGLQNAPVKFYSFYDITAAGEKNRRFEELQVPLIQIGEQQADSLKNRLFRTFIK